LHLLELLERERNEEASEAMREHLSRTPTRYRASAGSLNPEALGRCAQQPRLRLLDQRFMAI
jgi:hypothetical protein